MAASEVSTSPFANCVPCTPETGLSELKQSPPQRSPFCRAGHRDSQRSIYSEYPARDIRNSNAVLRPARDWGVIRIVTHPVSLPERELYFKVTADIRNQAA